MILENVANILKLLTNKSLSMSGGWELCEALSLICKNVGRDEDVFDESELA